MPTAYIKKLAKLNHTTVNKIEKFWAQAKEIAKSEGNGKAWGLITTIFQNKLKKEGYKVTAFTSLADTDELDDADLGLDVNPKEYHKQKSLQMSLQSKLDMIKKDLNKEADDSNEELVQWAKELNKRNRRTYASDNYGDYWLKYNGPVNKEVLIKAWKDGAYYDGRDKRKKEKLKEFENGMLKTYLKLLNKKEIVVYRGLNFFKYFSKDKTTLNKALKYFKYNLMDRNSWTISKQKAKAYSDKPYPKYGIILKMTCSLEDVNLPLSAYLEGAWSWFFFNNREVNLRKSFNVKNIEVIQAGEKVENLVSSKVTAFKEESREVDDKEFIFKRLSLSDCVKQIKDLFYDYFNFGKKDPEYYEKLYNTKVDESTASDLLPDDTTVYIEYNNGSKWYSVDNPKLKDLKLTGIKNCIIEYPEYTVYFGKDCRIERFDDAEDAPYVIKCEAKMNKYSRTVKPFSYKGQIITASSKKEAIKKIIAVRDAGYSEDAMSNVVSDKCFKLSKDLEKYLNSIKELKEFPFVIFVTWGTYDLEKKDKYAVVFWVGFEHGRFGGNEFHKTLDEELEYLDKVLPYAKKFMSKHKDFQKTPKIDTKFYGSTETIRVRFMYQPK